MTMVPSRQNHENLTPLSSLLGHQAMLPLLTKQRELDLAGRTKRGDKKAKDQLIQRNMRLVAKIAMKYAGYGLPLEDLVQEGTAGLIYAINKYDPTKGYRLSTYATWWIRQAIGRSLSNTGRTVRIPVHVGHKIGKLYRAEERLHAELGRQPTDHEISADTGIPHQSLDNLRVVAMKTLSIDAPANRNGQGSESDPPTIASSLPDETPEATVEPFVIESIENTSNNELLHSMISNLPPEQKSVILLRFKLRIPANCSNLRSTTNKRPKDRNGLMPVAEISEALGIDRHHTSKLISKAMTSLKNLAGTPAYSQAFTAGTSHPSEHATHPQILDQAI